MTLKRRSTGKIARVISREQSPGLDVTLIRRQRLCEFYVTVRPLPGEGVAGMMTRLAAALRQQHGASIVKLDVFGRLSARPATLRQLSREFGAIDWPLTWVDGADCTRAPLAGLHALAVIGAEVEPVCLRGRRVGSLFHDGHARHCFLGDLGPSDVSLTPSAQCRQTYANMDAALAAAGMKMTDLVRTWFFLDDILSWYDDFNKVRREVYRRKGLIGHLVPASTGVGARNPAGAALTVGAWAIQPLNGSVVVQEVGSPLQCPAPEYGSCFSRAVELATPDHRHLLVSGTASIEPGGRSVHDGDIDKQVQLTMDVVLGIIKARGMKLADVSRVTAYFKQPKYAPAFVKWCARNRAAFLPVVATRSDVCRDELLFEIEMDAVTRSASAR